MALITDSMRDWSYREATRRLHRAGQRHLPRHAAGVRIDSSGNRIVDCQCGWSGNGLGWLSHVDHIISDALRD
jgi:hypothetical protein